MLDHTLTPRMTRHALERCQEMGIPARVAKGIYRRPSVVRPSQSQNGRPGTMVTSDLFPGYAVIIADAYDGHPVVVTVVFHTTETYTRQGATFTTKEGK